MMHTGRLLYGIGALLAPVIAIAGDGELDPSFAGNGKAVVGFSSDGSPTPAAARAVAVQADGKIALAGYFRNSVYTTALARLTADGALDAGFGDNGRVSEFPHVLNESGDSAEALALQPDGKIVVFGFVDTDTHDYAYLARLTVAGQFDTTFGNGGIVYYPAVGQGSAHFAAGALAADGRILASGYYDAETGDGPSLLNVLFNADGSVAAAQNVSTVQTLFDKGAVVMQADGKAVIATTAGSDCAIARIDVGSSLGLDSSFGSDGIARFGWNLGGDDQDFCYALALQRDGKILLGGQARSDDSNGSRASVLRLLPDGTLDPAFGKKNFTFASGAAGLSNITTAILVRADQRIVLTGIAGTEDPAHEPQDFGAIRLLADGSIDATFTASTPGSSLGKVVFGFETGPSGRVDEAFGAALQSNRIVIAGFRERTDNSIAQFAIARLQNDALFADGFERP